MTMTDSSDNDARAVPKSLGISLLTRGPLRIYCSHDFRDRNILYGIVALGFLILKKSFSRHALIHMLTLDLFEERTVKVTFLKSLR